MQIVEAPLSSLYPHPRNSNVMPERMLAKLAEHIARTGRYPPLIVRPRGADGYELLDGHHRAAALRRIGAETARCMVWDVDDAEALVLLATLNRLEGQDDAKKRGALIAELAQQASLKDLAARLPEELDHLKKLAALDCRAPAPRPPRSLATMPQAVHFFLLPEQRRRLEERLRAIGGTREAALMTLVEG